MQTFESRLFEKEAVVVLGHLRELADRKNYRFEGPTEDWLCGASVTLSNDLWWIRLTAERHAGTLQEIANANGFSMSTSWGHQRVVLYRTTSTWRVQNPDMAIGDSVEVNDVVQWLDKQIANILD